MAEMSLKCRCGAVQGVASNVSSRSGVRLVCYCKDCQAFAHRLGHEEDVLDPFGGTEIFQMTPAQITITQGADQLRCLRLTPKGLFRWYTGCCRTPIGNTVSAKLPFVGVIHTFMPDKATRDRELGPVLGAVNAKSATRQPSGPEAYPNASFLLILRSISRALFAKLRGEVRSPFFDASGAPVSEPEIQS